jgi:membrane dipeptidase
VVDHVDHVVGRIGIDHVGFGSDFDGAKVPDELGDAAGLPRVVDALRQRGYSGDEIAKLAHGNWLRVLHETWLD